MLREYSFGLQRGRDYFSNVSREKLEALVGDIELRIPERKLQEKIIVLEMNETYHHFLLEELRQKFPELLTNIAFIEQNSPRYEHHLGKTIIRGYASLPPSFETALIGRMKDPGSALEKIARKASQTNSLERSIIPGHANFLDTWGYTFVLADRKSIEKAEQSLQKHPYFKLINREETKKENGYQALKNNYLWTGKIVPPIVLEVRFQTGEEWKMTQTDAPHEAYKKEMLACGHQRKGYQVIIYMTQNGKMPQETTFLHHKFVEDVVVIK